MRDASVVIETSAGEIAVDVFAQTAPRTSSYFLGLVSDGAYDGSTLYRSTTLGVENGPRLVQGGPLARVFAPGGPVVGPAPKRFDLLPDFETTADTGLRHTAGTLSLARDLASTGHAIPEFFVCLGDFPQLDAGGRSEPDERGFPAFGQVTRGLALVEDIAGRATGGSSSIERLEGEVLSSQVRIPRIALQI